MVDLIRIVALICHTINMICLLANISIIGDCMLNHVLLAPLTVESQSLESEVQ